MAGVGRFPTRTQVSLRPALMAQAASLMEMGHKVADSAAALLWTGDAEGTCLYVNQAWLDFTGRTLAEELGEGWTDRIHPDDRPEVLAALADARSNRATVELEFRLQRRDDQDRWLLAVWRARHESDGRFAGYVGSCVDISDRKQAQFDLEALLAESGHAQAQLAAQAQQLHHLADSDPLTGLLNRRSFRDQFKREWSRAVRYDRPIACVMLDIDYFKRVNDAHGHAAGDAVLERVAELLVGHCRPSDRVCRYGGEEFCIMVPETSEQGAAVLAERLRSTLATTPFEAGGKSLEITSSFGVAERTADMADLEDLIDRADRALYLAKHSGRNRVVRHSSRDLAELATEDSPLRILARYTAGELAVPIPLVNCDASIRFAAESLLKAGAESAPVVDGGGRLVGFVSERDLMASDVSCHEWSRSVGEVMKTSVVCYEHDTPAQQIYQLLCRVTVRQVVVVKAGRPVGVITPGTLLRFFHQRVATQQP